VDFVSLLRRIHSLCPVQNDVEMIGRWMRIAPLGLLLVACDRPEDGPAPPAGEPVAAVDSADAVVPARTADSAAAGLAVVAERRGGGYLLFGRTDAAGLELSVEDGHDVLYGPETVAVSRGAFRVEVALGPTDRETVFAYFAEAGGDRQWVVPIPLDGSRVAWGTGAAELVR
jgi:hypothetical protein